MSVAAGPGRGGRPGHARDPPNADDEPEEPTIRASSRTCAQRGHRNG